MITNGFQNISNLEKAAHTAVIQRAPLQLLLLDLKKFYVLELIKLYGDNISEIARRSGVHRNTIYRWINENKGAKKPCQTVSEQTHLELKNLNS